ncbi:hypothetical protein FOZ60_008097 [Perkinsus olseni]|uniref:Uncharacterized protein n=1 Tax=Perkinsus olseni TaxID=32597 RepID=A0A7J6NLF5_PEROL|nr:hypothetical protein FOZ60_008097 [Perkinsus olseni]
MPVARHSDLGELLTVGVFIVQAGGVRFGEPENQVNILYDVRTPPYLKHGACFEHPVFGRMPSTMDDLLLLAKAYKESRNLQDYNEQALGDILSSSFINNQRLDPRWLSLDSEDSEAKSRVAAGGDLAMQELRKLIVAAGDPSNLDDLRSRGLLGTARTLMSRESSTDELKSLAGTLITLLTDLPISSNVANVNTGADGRVTGTRLRSVTVR